MKKFYAVLVPVLVFLAACKKDNPNAYDKQLTRGTWELYDYEIPSYSTPPFLIGDFTFKADGQTEYKDYFGNIYKGTWDLTQRGNPGNQGLLIDVTYSGERKIVYFDSLARSADDLFEAYINHPTNSKSIFMFQLKRQ